MDEYDPNRTPDPSEWLELDELSRIDLVAYYHEEAEVELPNARLHAVMHAVVENQIALGTDPVPETVVRLIREGLDRHEAVHAVGAILAGNIFDIMKGVGNTWDLEKYRRRLAKLTAKRWRKGKW